MYDEYLEISLVLELKFPFFWDKMLHHWVKHCHQIAPKHQDLTN